MRDAPAYPHGATMALDHARWVATHVVNRVESTAQGLRLHAGNAALETWCEGGLRLAGGGLGRPCVELIMPVAAHVGGILEWEAEHPDERPVASPEGSLRHRSWSALRRLRDDALVAALDPVALDAARVRNDGIAVGGLRVRPAGTAPVRVAGAAFAVGATIGVDRARPMPGDHGLIAIGRLDGDEVTWHEIFADHGVADLKAAVGGILTRMDAA